MGTHNFTGSIGLSKNQGAIFALPENRAVFSLKLNYNKYIDHINSNSNSEAYSAVVLFEGTF